jgi:DNA-binding transcriptional MocR family regulator
MQSSSSPGTGSPEALVHLDRSRPRSLRSQLEVALRDAIRDGRLAPGTRLPSTRALAADLGITRGVVVDAYDQLRAEGYILTRPGSGTIVSPRATAGRPAPGTRSPASEAPAGLGTPSDVPGRPFGPGPGAGQGRLAPAHAGPTPGDTSPGHGEPVRERGPRRSLDPGPGDPGFGRTLGDTPADHREPGDRRGIENPTGPRSGSVRGQGSAGDASARSPGPGPGGAGTAFADMALGHRDAVAGRGRPGVEDSIDPRAEGTRERGSAGDGSDPEGRGPSGGDRGGLPPVGRPSGGIEGAGVAAGAGVATAAAGAGVGAGRWDFRPGMPDLGLVPRAAWQRAWRDGFGRLPDGELGYGDPRGAPALRQALAAYLGRVRGVIADPENVVVCNGFSHGLSLVAEALLDQGIDRVAIEDPGQPGLQHVVQGSGLTSVPCPVDAEGLDVEALWATGCRAVLLTPAHQFPTGVVLGAGRRSALADWARQVGGAVIEDDYDAEYRYDRYPVGAVQGVVPERGIYAGTLSKSLAPGFRLGWLVVPPPLLETIVTRRGATDLATNAPMQAALTLFLERGDLDRHLRRTRRIYAQRRDAFVAAVDRLLPDAELDGVAAGLHVVLRLPEGTDERALTAAAAGRGVTVYPMADYRRSADAYPTPALVLGYGNLNPDALTAGVEQLAAAYRSLAAH